MGDVQSPSRIDPVKAAALRIAALSTSDRAWLMAQLSPEERRTLAPHLDELKPLHPGHLQSVLPALEVALSKGTRASADTPVLLTERLGYLGIANARNGELRVIRSELPAAAATLLDQLTAPADEASLDRIDPRRKRMLKLLAEVVEERLADVAASPSFEALMQRPAKSPEPA